jgi:hypothetical protein
LDDDDEEEDDLQQLLVSRSMAQLPVKTQKVINSTDFNHDPQEIVHHWSPKKIVSSWTDSSGGRHLIVLVSMKSGLSEKDRSGVDVKVTKDGLELSLSEKWDNFVLDVESFYHVFPKDPRESDAEYCLRKAAMMTSVSKLKTYSQGAALYSVYCYRLPFRCDPDEKRVTCISSGTLRVVHIDLAERRRVDCAHWHRVVPPKKTESSKMVTELSQLID